MWDYTDYFTLSGSDNLHRANNQCEGYHRLVNEYIGEKKLKLGFVLLKFEKMYETIRDSYKEFEREPRQASKTFIFDLKVNEMFTKEV